MSEGTKALPARDTISSARTSAPLSERWQHGLAALSGIGLVLCFPDFPFGPLALVALVPFLVVLRDLVVHGGPATRGARLGYEMGLIFFTGLLFWVWNVTRIGTVALILFQAVYPAAFGALVVWIGRRTRLPFALIAATVWMGLEHVREMGYLGFPWGQLGYALAPYPALIQPASVGGVWLVTAILAAHNALWAQGAWEWWRAGGPTQGARRQAAGALGLVGALALWGGIVLWGTEEPAPGPQVALVQGNIDQDQKWDRAFRTASFNKYARLSRGVSGQGVDLYIWPETAAPCYLLETPEWRSFVRDLVEELDGPLLTGGLAWIWRDEEDPVHHNSAFLFKPASDAIPRYDKIHLVPFGERLPLVDAFPWLMNIHLGQANFTPGAQRRLYEGGGVRFPALICFEAIFGDEVRAFVQDGADVLVNITNDAWFGRHSAAGQHAMMTVFRAVEHRIGLARCANTGITMFVDPYGRIVQRTGTWEDAVLVGAVPQRTGDTLYTRLGDWVAWAALAGCLVLVGLALIRRPEPV